MVKMIWKTISWAVYALSSLSFLFIYGDAVTSFFADPFLTTMPFVPAGLVSVGIRNLPCNLTMFAGAAVVINWMRINWHQRDTAAWVSEGWGWVQYWYCALGLITAICWVLALLLRNAHRPAGK
jgi:hypothetical protein